MTSPAVGHVFGTPSSFPCAGPAADFVLDVGTGLPPAAPPPPDPGAADEHPVRAMGRTDTARTEVRAVRNAGMTGPLGQGRRRAECAGMTTIVPG
jgi:hypothetical protein